MPFVKFWTEARGDAKYLAMNCIQRGVFHQCIIICKSQLDDGYVRWRTWSAMASDMSCHVHTCRKIAAFLTQICIVNFRTDEHGNIEGYIPNYNKWQAYTAKDVVAETRKSAAKV